MIEECQDKICYLTQERDYARTHQKIVEIPVEKPVLYEKCEACNRTAYQNAKARYETQKEQLAGQYKAKTMFLYNMTSNIRSIAKDINTSADNILDETDNKKVNMEVINDSARDIKGNAAKFTTMTNEVFDISNIDSAGIIPYFCLR